MQSPVLTIASFNDAAAICQVLHSAYQTPRTVGQINDYFGEDYTIILLKLEVACAGVAIVRWLLDEAEIIDLGIHVDYQRQRLGSQLLAHVIELATAKQCQSLFLEVRQSNERAIKLYQKVGFKVMGLRKNYYPTQNGREDAVTMKYNTNIT